MAGSALSLTFSTPTMTLPVPNFLSPTDLIKAAELATNAGDPALALQFLKTASAATKTHAVVAAAPAGAIKPIEGPGVVLSLIPDPPNNEQSLSEKIYLAVTRYLQQQHIGYRFRFHQMVAILQLDSSLVLDEKRYTHWSGRTVWKDKLSYNLAKLQGLGIIRKGSARTEYVLERLPFTVNL